MTSQTLVDPPRNRSWKFPAIIAGGALIAASAIGGIALAVTKPTNIERVYEACEGSKPIESYLADEGQSDNSAALSETFSPMLEGVLALEDNGKTLIIQTKGQDDDPLGVGSLVVDCVFEELPVPAFVQTNIRSVTASSGRLSETWDGYEATFGYHPDNGANIVIVKR
ncbi:hypothetical protein [uncultured Microbacterium sp.]|uniref:hypothetical protein n=1 Tax=uncultured Microbacterium sp. TaxID=191216 RepID=UPI00260DA71B|nr:hypothetical protein [uncultured Microbacterium sp.]